MRLLRRIPTLVSCLAMLVVAAPAAPAQEAGSGAALLALRAGLSVYGTGDDANCAHLPALSAGLQGRTPGAAFAAISGDLFLTGPSVACTDMLRLVPLGPDQYAEEFAGVWLGLSPRLALHLGAELDLRSYRLEPVVGTGLLYSLSMEEERGQWRSWTGGALSAGRRGGRFALRGEYGWHRVAVRHEVYRWSTSEAPPVHLKTRNFERWRPIGQVGVQYRW